MATVCMHEREHVFASLASFAWHCFALEHMLALIASLAWLVLLAI